MDPGLGQRETLGDHLGRPAHPKKSPRNASLEIGGTYSLFFETGLDQPSFVDANMEIRECFPDILASAEKAKSGSEFFVATNGNIEK